MAFKKSLAQRLLTNITKLSPQTFTSRRISSPNASVLARIINDPSRPSIEPDPGDKKAPLGRFLHRNPTSISPELRQLPLGDTLFEKLKLFDLGKDRIRLDGMVPPPAMAEKVAAAVEARKLLKVAQMEMVKERLREREEVWISKPEFMRVVSEGCSDPNEGVQLAKLLDESGHVVVFGDTVLLRPDLVTKAVKGLFPPTNQNDSRRKELEEMEMQKALIDCEAESLVRKELWCGLGFLILQTAGFMRLTFWELSWDVMEPICFYVTSMYFMAGYAFFLRTTREPSFEGFYHSRFSAKQKKLMKNKGFDLKRYNELRKAVGRRRSLMGHEYEQKQLDYPAQHL